MSTYGESVSLIGYNLEQLHAAYPHTMETDYLVEVRGKEVADSATLSQLYSQISELSLESLRNGVFIHSQSVCEHLAENGGPVRLMGEEVVHVFGSEGDGAYLAVVDQGKIVRLTGGAVISGTYDGRIEVVADSLVDFLSSIGRDLGDVPGLAQWNGW